MSTNDPRIGLTIDGRYVVRRWIGKGGMGAVYEAEQPSLGRKVAIKFLLARDSAHAERFRREARLASQVIHEHVAQVYDVGRTPDGIDYLVMEYVEGSDLAYLLRDVTLLPVERAIAIVRAVLEGLAAIHALEIVHRDIKPSNVLLATRGDDVDFVKLVDFGLARAADDATLTKTGHIVGTTPFMAPEVFRGEELDHRADLYAVGITLYQMLAGKLPFEGATAEIGALHVWSPPPPLGEQRAELPPWLVRVVERALAKAPGDRFADAQSFIDALDRKQVAEPPTVVERRAPSRPRPSPPAPSPTPTSPPVRRTRARWPWLFVGLAIAGGAAVGAFLARPQSGAVAVASPDAAITRAPLDSPIAAEAVDARVLANDAAIASPPQVDAGVRHPRHSSRPAKAAGMCHCLGTSGENTPLCAKQGKPLCRCVVGRLAPLCPALLVECDYDRREQAKALGVDLDRVCSSGLVCPELTWMMFARAGTHGAPCTGYTTNHADDGYDWVEVNVRRTGTFACDTCPGANNRVYAGAEGDPCTGYHWRTGDSVAGTLQHCEP